MWLVFLFLISFYFQKSFLRKIEKILEERSWNSICESSSNFIYDCLLTLYINSLEKGMDLREFRYYNENIVIMAIIDENR